VNPAMDKALEFLQKFAKDAKSGKIPKDRLRFGSPWKHPSKLDDPTQCQQWAKLQLLDFVQSLINTEFGVTCFLFFILYLIVLCFFAVAYNLQHLFYLYEI